MTCPVAPPVPMSTVAFSVRVALAALTRAPTSQSPVPLAYVPCVGKAECLSVQGRGMTDF